MPEGLHRYNSEQLALVFLQGLVGAQRGLSSYAHLFCSPHDLLRVFPRLLWLCSIGGEVGKRLVTSPRHRAR